MLDQVYEQYAQLVAARVAEILRDRGGAVVQEYLSAAEAATYLGMSERTLNNYRVNGRQGPAFTRLGQLVRYRVADLDAWADSNRVECP